MNVIYKLQSATGIMSTHTFTCQAAAEKKCQFLNNLTSCSWYIVALLVKE